MVGLSFKMKFAILGITFILIQYTTETAKVLAERKRGGYQGWRNYDRRPRRYEGSRGGEGYDTSRTLSDEDLRKLEMNYGTNTVRQHYGDFETALNVGQNYGPHEHKIPWRSIPNNQPVSGLDKDALNDAKLNAINDQMSLAEVGFTGDENRQYDHREDDLSKITDDIASSDHRHHCNIHGLWKSYVAGVAIELIPNVQENGKVEIRTQIFDLPNYTGNGILTTKWTGQGMIATESPTTMAIVFQEHVSEIANYNNLPVATGLGNNIGNVILPKTAVFVGQCLVCENSPILQGTWTVFPITQSCVTGIKNNNSTEHLDKFAIPENHKFETLHLLKSTNRIQ